MGGDLEFDTNIGSPDDDENDGEEGVSAEYSDSKPGGYSDEDELDVDRCVKA